MSHVVDLPALHPGQVAALRMPARFKAIRCGRRWGKTALATCIASDASAKGRSVGIFTPTFKFKIELYSEIIHYLSEIIDDSSENKGRIRTLSGGQVDFWSLIDPRAGRGRKYHLVIIDEAAFTKDDMIDIWRKSIRPTLVDYRGKAVVFSNTNGIRPENFFWQICNKPELGFKDFHAPTHDNPYLPRDEVENLVNEMDPLVYRQEILAEFVDWSGVAFFAIDNLLVEGQAVELPPIVDSVFATIDTAVKDRSEHDGTAVIYWARSAHFGHPLVILDWEILKIEGSLLERWLPGVFARLDEFTKLMKVRFGPLGAWIEDKQSGSILLQQARRRGWKAHAIDNELTDAGKDGRAISVSGYVYRGEVKLSRPAYDKVMHYNGVTMNHLISQVAGFRLGNKGAAADDLLDCFTYGISVSRGNAKGI